MDEQTISSAYQRLAQSRLALWQATEITITRRLELEKERGARLMTGEIVGKNEVERDARARELLTSLYAALEAAESEERKARLAYDLDRIETERIEAVLRLLSASKRE